MNAIINSSIRRWIATLLALGCLLVSASASRTIDFWAVTGSDDDVAAAFGKLAETCVACHARFLE